MESPSCKNNRVKEKPLGTHRAASQMVHLSIAIAGFDSMQIEHVQLPLGPLEVTGFIPAAAQSKGLGGGGGGGVDLGVSTLFTVGGLKSKVGREDFGIDFASSRALRLDGELASTKPVATEKTNVGSALAGIASATSCGVFLGT